MPLPQHPFNLVASFKSLKSLGSSASFKLSEVINSALDVIFPLDQVCMSCGKVVHMAAPYLCDGCAKHLIPPEFPCQVCGWSKQGPDLACGHCNPTAATFKKTVLGYALNPVTKSMVYKQKYGHQRYLAHSFAQMLIQRLNQEGFTGKEFTTGSFTHEPKVELVQNTLQQEQGFHTFNGVMSIPSGKKRVNMRGCDHCFDIAKEVAKYYNVPIVRPLRRVQHEHAQAGLSRKERERNMAHAFEKISDLPVGMALLVIDDVYTTGQTLEQAGVMLKGDGITLYAATTFYTPEKFE